MLDGFPPPQPPLPGWTHGNGTFPLTEAKDALRRSGTLLNASSLFAPLFGFKGVGGAWGGGALCSKVVPLLPERLLTFMNRAFTPEFSPAGCLLCALYKSVSSHAATGDVSRGRSFPLVAVGRIHSHSLLLLSH